MRLWLIAVPLVLSVGALAASACVGDDPVTASGPSGVDAGDASAKEDASTSGNDGAVASDGGASCDYAAKVKEDQPLHYYRFGVASPANEGSADGGITGDAGTALASGAVACEAPDRSAVIDGTKAIELRGDLDAPYNSPFSIELLFEPEAGTQAFSRLFSRESFPEAPGTKNLQGYALVYDPSTATRTVIFSRYEYQDAGTVPSSVFVTLEDKPGFRHVVATFDGTNMKVYVDGGIRGTVPSTIMPKPSPAAHALIGARIPPAGGFDGRFKGRIDEVAYYNHALSEERVTIHYASLH